MWAEVVEVLPGGVWVPFGWDLDARLSGTMAKKSALVLTGWDR